MSDPNSSPPQVPLSEVRAFLAGQPVADRRSPRPDEFSDPRDMAPPPPLERVSVALGGEQPTPGVAPPPADESPEQEPETEQQRIDTGDPSFATNLTGPSMDNVTSWAYEDDSYLGKVEVTDEDKTYYLKAALNDTELRLDVALGDGTVKVTCRTVTNTEAEILFRALKKLEDAGRITSGVQQFSYMRWLNICMQVVAVNGKQLHPLRFNKEADLDTAADALIARYQQTFADFNQVTWQLMQVACRVFECKQKICNDNLANLDFWQLAGGV